MRHILISYGWMMANDSSWQRNSKNGHTISDIPNSNYKITNILPILPEKRQGHYIFGWVYRFDIPSFLRIKMLTKIEIIPIQDEVEYVGDIPRFLNTLKADIINRYPRISMY